jgi:hypothetical protein
MKKIVIMPGGFHPFHAGHAALYQSAIKAFPDAEVYVAASNDTKTRPFPFSIKEKLAKLAGVAPGHFIQVKSPFQSQEITSHYNPDEDVLIFVRSEKDRNESPKPGGTKKDGSPSYYQPWTGKNLQPFSKHAYMAYLPTVEFGPGITSATEIRKAWPTLNDKRKTAMVMSLYPATQKNPKLAANVVKMLDMGMGGENLEEGLSLHDVAWIGNLVPSFMQRIASAGTREAKQTAILGKILGKWVGTGELTPAEEAFAKQQLIDIAKMIAGMAVASAVTASAPAHAAASAVASGVTHIAQHGAVDLGLDALAVMLSKNFKFDFLKKIMHSLETDSGKAFSHVEKKQFQAPHDDVDKQVNQQFQKAKMGFGGMSEGVAEGTEQQLVTIYTNPAYKGATVDDRIKKSLPVTEAPFNKLQMWENGKSMKDPKVAQWVNNNLLPQLKQNGKLGPLVVWNNKGQLFVIDGNHRFIAYQAAGYNGNVPVQIVPDNMINIVDTVPGQQGVAEGLDDPWGDQGNFVGDTPQPSIGGDTVKRLVVGDIVTYFGQKARIDAMSKTGNTSRITIANKMGGTTKDVLTRDLKRTGLSEENGGVGGGFGTNYPGTYEEENGPFTHKGGLRLTSLTTESVDYLDEK